MTLLAVKKWGLAAAVTAGFGLTAAFVVLGRAPHINADQEYSPALSYGPALNCPSGDRMGRAGISDGSFGGAATPEEALKGVLARNFPAFTTADFLRGPVSTDRAQFKKIEDGNTVMVVDLSRFPDGTWGGDRFVACDGTAVRGAQRGGTDTGV